jgi:Trk K+ transport system NAD-binding subunit
MLERTGIVSAYALAQERGVALAHSADRMAEVQERSATEVIKTAITAGSPLDGVELRDADFPLSSTVAAVRRAQSTIVPRGATRLEPGDEIVVLCAHEDARKVRAWLRDHT